jgi:uncharacterized phiE125 gp8 family phage protein
MNLYPVTAPAEEPITLEELMEHLRIAQDEEAQLLLGLIVSARQWGETFTGRAFVTQAWELKMACFPPVIELPKPPTASVTSVKYLDGAGTLQTLSSTLYLATGLASEARARIEPAYGSTWPTTYPVSDAVRVVFSAGYGAAAAVPQGIKAALLAHAAEAFRNRERPEFSVAEAAVWPWVETRFA